MTNEEYEYYKRFYECIKHFIEKSEYERKQFEKILKMEREIKNENN
ncbi:hypothetical protein [Parvimonas sp. G1641]